MFCKFFHFVLIEFSDVYHKDVVYVWRIFFVPLNVHGVFKYLLLISISFLEKTTSYKSENIFRKILQTSLVVFEGKNWSNFIFAHKNWKF